MTLFADRKLARYIPAVVLAFIATFACAPVLVAQQPQQPQQPQEPPYIFKSEVELVSLTATVEDQSGRAVAGLQQSDFRVLEDGVAQQISVFHNDETVPVSVGIAFDTSGSMVDKIDDVQDAVIHFIKTTNPEDDIFLLQFSGSTKLVQDFTGDREQLRKAVGRLRARGATALYDAIIEGLQRLQQGRHKKKALLVITDGNDTSSHASLQDAMGSAQQSEAIIYALGIGHGERGSFGHDTSFADYVDIDALNSLADATGGRAFLLQGAHTRNGVDQVDRAAQQVGTELRGQYTIAYKPVNKAKDGTYRKVIITVISHPEYEVRTRAGYFAPKQRASSDSPVSPRSVP